jgi:hypothetical protein
VFLDLGTPKAVDVVTTRDDEAAVILDSETPEEVALLTDVYTDLKCKLTARGIPADEIRFVQEAKTREARFHLFQAANDGLVRVIVGSTAKLGTGVNVQKRLAALHHLDAPWRPMDLEHFVVSKVDSCVRQAVTSFRVTLSCINGPGARMRVRDLDIGQRLRAVEDSGFAPDPCCRGSGWSPVRPLS